MQIGDRPFYTWGRPQTQTPEMIAVRLMRVTIRVRRVMMMRRRKRIIVLRLVTMTIILIMITVIMMVIALLLNAAASDDDDGRKRTKADDDEADCTKAGRLDPQAARAADCVDPR